MNFFDIFISYGRADSINFARKLNEKLMKKGLKVWFDQEDIEDTVQWQKAIDYGIETSHNFIFIMAPHAVKSDYCRQEIELAVKYNKRLIPLLYIDYWEGLHPEIAKVQGIPFQEEKNNFDQSFDRLINSIDKHKEYVYQHTDLLVQAWEWERNQKQTNYLLIGEERQKAEGWLKTKFSDKQSPCIPTDLHCEFICESVKNANNLMTQVFLSYSDKDKDRDIKEKIRKTLMRESFTVWTNKTDIKTGVAFSEEINKGIEGADNFIYLMSSDSLESEYCQRELAHAFAHNKRIIALLIEEVDTKSISSQLGELQFIDLTGYEDSDKYQKGVDQLLGDLKKDPSYYEKYKILLVKALKWQGQKENPSLLLRGYNLQQFEAWLKIAQQRKDYPPLPLQEKFITASLNKTEDASLEVFISYSRSDSDLARKINEQLQELGRTTWFDQESIATGTDFQQEIYRGIESSDNFLFIISPKSVNSPYCADEVEYAQKLNKRFVTILHRSLSEEDRRKQPSALASVQYLDFNQHGGDSGANFHELVRTLDTDKDHVRNHTEWSQKASKWQQRSQDEALLLRGSELGNAENWLSKAEKNNKKPPTTESQKKFIGASRESIDRQEKEKERQQKAEVERQKRDKRMAQGIAAGSVGALIISSGLGWMAWNEKNKAELNQSESLGRESLSLLNDNKGFEARIQAIKAGKILQNQHATNPEGLDSLREVLPLQVAEKNRLQGHKYLRSVSYSPDGQTLASGSYDGTVKIWEVGTGKLLQTLTVHKFSVNSDKFSVNSVSYSPDGKTLASGSEDKTVKIWEVGTGKLLQTLDRNESAVKSVSYSPDGKTLASGSYDGTVKIWEVGTGKLLQTLTGNKFPVTSVSYSPDSKTLASGGGDNTVKLWEVRTGKLLQTLTGHESFVQSVSYSLDGKALASASHDGTVKIWEVGTENLTQTLNGHQDFVESVSYSPNGQTLASASLDKTVKIWELGTGKLLRTLTGHKEGLYSVSYSPDGKTLASASHDGTVKIWEVGTGKLLRPLEGHKVRVNSVSYSPDGKTLASASLDKTVKIWEVGTGKLLRPLKGHESSVSSASYSPDGKTLASGGGDDKTVKIWEVGTGKLLRTLKGHESSVNSVSYSPDGKTLASGDGDDKTVKIWEVGTGKLLRTLKGHENYVNSVSYSPDGKTLASGSKDKTVKLWEIGTGKLLQTLTGHESSVRSVSYSPDGKTLASGSTDNTVKLWHLDLLTLDALMASNCDWVRDYLTNNPTVTESDRHLCDGI
jgi:WD40 repeat protein